MSAIQREVVALVTAQRWAAVGSIHEGQPLVSMIAQSSAGHIGRLRPPP